jgi:phospholipid-binding lipoprotein MlaA
VIEDHRLGSGAPVVRSPSQDEGSVRAQSKDASSANGEVRDAVSGSRLSVEPDASPPRPIGADEDLGPMNVDGNLRVDPFPDPFADTIQEEIDDPWEAFNSTMFTFNRNVDRFALKPAATAYEFVTPDFLERGVRNAFHNFGVVSRVVNNLLQGKFEGAGLEFSRFMINSTLGIAGLMDVAKDYFGMETPDEDLGQTLSVYGTPPGPYLVLPFMPPFTVRDAGAYVVDGLMNPANWLLPIFPTLIGMNGGEVVNDRSLNLERYEGVEEGTVDLYGAVRDAYKQKRAQAIKE